MLQRNKTILKIILVLLALGVLLIIACGLWLNEGEITPLKTKVFQVVPYPLALVNGESVSVKSYLLRLDVAKKLLGDDAGAKTAVYNQLITDEKTRQIAASHNISVSKKELEAEYNERSGQVDFQDTLKSYGLSPEDFKTHVLRPELLLIKLQIWYNVQKDLNASAHDLADSLIQKLAQGEDMTTLATNFSEDSQGKATGGDLGFLDAVQILPELREPVENMNIGETKILASRFGLHIIKKQSQKVNQAHLRQIFLKTGDFDQWLAGEHKNFKVWNLIKI